MVSFITYAGLLDGPLARSSRLLPAAAFAVCGVLLLRVDAIRGDKWLVNE